MGEGEEKGATWEEASGDGYGMGDKSTYLPVCDHKHEESGNLGKSEI